MKDHIYDDVAITTATHGTAEPPKVPSAEASSESQAKSARCALATCSLPVSYRDLFGRDDVEILRVDGADEEMPDSITIRVGKRAAVFQRQPEENDKDQPRPSNTGNPSA